MSGAEEGADSRVSELSGDIQTPCFSPWIRPRETLDGQLKVGENKVRKINSRKMVQQCFSAA